MNNRQKRQERLTLARQNGSHTKEEWEKMILFFESKCVKCFGTSGLANVERDHIIPIYQIGSSDGIDNIQPMCARCNASKGPEKIDYRPRLALFLEKDLPEQYKLKRNG